MKKIEKDTFFKRHKQVILYFAFGAITSVCSLGACYLTLILGVRLSVFRTEGGTPTALLDILGSTVQWIVGVAVAFATNKKWVFTSAPKGLSKAIKQLVVFSSSRVGTYFLEVLLNLGLIALLPLLIYKEPTLTVGALTIALNTRFWAKIISSVVVVITNYFISKFLVFRNRSEQ